MTSLFVLTNDYLQLAETLADGDFDATTVSDTIEASGIMDSLQDKAQALEFVARDATAHNTTIDAEIARLTALKAQRERIAAGLRNYLKTNMERAGIQKITCPLFSISIRNNPPAVEIIDQLSLPTEYWHTPEPKPPVPMPDKSAIKAALQSGIEIMGAKLTQSTRLAIS